MISRPLVFNTWADKKHFDGADKHEWSSASREAIAYEVIIFQKAHHLDKKSTVMIACHKAEVYGCIAASAFYKSIWQLPKPHIKFTDRAREFFIFLEIISFAAATSNG